MLQYAIYICAFTKRRNKVPFEINSMKKHLFIILIISSAFRSFAQRDSLQNQILNYTDSTSEIIIKGRGLLADKFVEGDYQKVREIKDFLLSKVQDKNYVVFYPSEYCYILYWTQQYNKLLASMAIRDSINNYPYRSIQHFDDLRFDKQISPPNDLLQEKLYRRSKDSILQLYSFIDNSSLKKEDKDFLKIRLQYITSMSDYKPATRDSLNLSADRFLESYPNSSYNSFIRKYIRFEFVPSKWGFVFEFFSGYGILTKELNNTFFNPVPIGIAFDVYYKKFGFFLRDYIGFSKTKKDVPYNNGIWEKGSQVRVFLPEASLGYVVLDNKIAKITPFAGFSGTAFLATDNDEEKNPELKKAGLKFTNTYTAGVNLDIKLGTSKTEMVSFNEESYWFLRLRYGYNLPQFQKRYNGYNGAMHYITVGIGGFGRAIKRKY